MFFLVANSTIAQKSNSMFNSGDKTKVLDYYEFVKNIELTVESLVVKDSAYSKEEIKFFFNQYDDYFGAETKLKGETGDYNIATSIFDWKNKIIVSLIDANNKKMGMVMARKWKGVEALDNPYTISKLKEMQSVLGYNCNVYLLENDNATIKMWITKDESINLAAAFNYFSTDNKKAKSRKLMPEGSPDGLILKSIYKSKLTNESHTLTINKVNNNTPVKISTSGYTFF